MSTPASPLKFEFIKVVAGVIQKEMDLDPSRVFLYNQEVDLQPDQGMYINIGFLGAKPFGSSLSYVSDPVEGLLENQSINMQETYSILIYSFDSTARQRKQDILFALNGQLMQQMAEKYSFRIATIPSSFVDVSEVEGTSRIDRYSLTFNALVAYGRLRAVDYFNNFPSNSPTLAINP
jgi:hypothetical protein